MNHKKIDTDTQAKIIELIMESIPHGSGIDGDWNIYFAKSGNGNIICENSIHKMDSNGFYCGWANLRVGINPYLMLCTVGQCPKDYEDYCEQAFNAWFTDTIKKPLMGFMGYRGFTWDERTRFNAALHEARKVLMESGMAFDWNETHKEASRQLNDLSLFVDSVTIEGI